jgi:hypothetical protein
LVVNVNGCDATNKKVEVVGLPANTSKGVLVKLANGAATYPLQSVSDDGHGWIENVSAEAIKSNCPATVTPIPQSSTNSNNSIGNNNIGMMSAGSGAAAISHDNCAACHSAIPTPKK